MTVLGRAPGHAGGEIGYLPQRRSFDPDLRIRGVDVVRLGSDGDRWGLPLPGGSSLFAGGRERRRRVAEVIELVGATAYAHRPIGQVSGGEQQRLLIAQALVRRPRMLLLDEPLDSLDLPNQASVAALISDISREFGITVMIVAHDVNPIVSYLDGVVYVARGGAVCGPPDEVITSETLSRPVPDTDRGPSDRRTARWWWWAAPRRRPTTPTATPGTPTDGTGHCAGRGTRLERRRRPAPDAGASLHGQRLSGRDHRGRHRRGHRLVHGPEAPELRRAHPGGGVVPGAAGAIWLGISATAGYFAGSIVAALAIAMVPRSTSGRAHSEETAVIGTVQAFALACGVLFVSLYGGFLDSLTGLLFGTFLGISDGQVVALATVAAAVLVLLAVIARPLFFSTVDADVAEARGVPVRMLSVVFLLLLGCAAAEVSQITGALLVFALLVMPAAAAQQLTVRPALSLFLTVALALGITWVSLTVAFYSVYPVGFYVSTFGFGAYVLAAGARAVARRLGSRSSGRAPAATSVAPVA